MPILWHQTRSMRVTITPPEGPAIVIDNMEGNTGYEIDFEVRRTMTPELGEVSLSIYNLPADVRGDLDAAQVRQVTDLDQILAAPGVPQGWQVFGSTMAVDGASALAVGLPLITIEAGYDGAVSQVFSAVGATLLSKRADDTTYVTEITAIEGLDALLYSRPTTVFPEGSPTYDLVTFIRQALGIGQGNATAAQWTALLGDSRLDAPFYNDRGGFKALATILDFLPIRWWIDERELWIVARDGQPVPPGSPPPWLPGAVDLVEPLVARPERLDGGFVGVTTLLLPLASPGRLITLTPAALGLGFDATPAEIQRAEVPPGVYRIEEVAHVGTTSTGGDFNTQMKLKPGFGG